MYYFFFQRILSILHWSHVSHCFRDGCLGLVSLPSATLVSLMSSSFPHIFPFSFVVYIQFLLFLCLSPRRGLFFPSYPAILIVFPLLFFFFIFGYSVLPAETFPDRFLLLFLSLYIYKTEKQVIYHAQFNHTEPVPFIIGHRLRFRVPYGLTTSTLY